MDVQAKLEEINALVEGARAMPMSASCILNRGELLAHLDELRDMLPGELAQAQDLLHKRSDIVDEGRQEADRILEEARQERARLVTETEVAAEAHREAARVVATAHEDAERIRADVDEYVDTKLANFEVVLHKTLRAVERGRAKLKVGGDVGELPEGSEYDLSQVSD